VTLPQTETIAPSDAPGRLLFHRPDLAAQRKQRNKATQLSEWTGHNRSAIDILAGCLAVLPDYRVEDLVEHLAASVETRLREANPSQQAHFRRPAYRIEAALELGWSLLGNGRHKMLLQVLALVNGGPLSPALLCRAAAAPSGDLDEVIRAGFCSTDSRDYLAASPKVLDFLQRQQALPDERAHLQFGLVDAVRTALIDTEHEHDESLELAYHTCWELCAELNRQDLRASLTHRMVGLLRMRGETESARDQAARTLAAIDGTDSPCPSDLLLLLRIDRAILQLEAGEVQAGLAALDTLLADLEAATDADAASLLLLRRVRLIHSQARAFFLRDDDAEQAVGDLRTESENTDNPSLSQLEGLLLLRRGAAKDAQSKLKEAYASGDDEAQVGSAQRAAFALSLAQACSASGRSSEAAELLEQARVLSGGDLDRRPLATLPLVLHELGVLAADEHRLAVAGTFFDEAAMLAESTLPAAHPTRLQITYSRGLVHLAHNDFRQATSRFEKVIARADPDLPGQLHVELLARCARVLAWSIEGPDKSPLANEENKVIGEILEQLPGDTSALREELQRIGQFSV